MSIKLFRYAVLVTMMVCSVAMTAMAVEESDVQIRVAKPGATVTIDRVIDHGKVLVSVVDAGENPLFGLRADDFAVTQAGLRAEILNARVLGARHRFTSNIGRSETLADVTQAAPLGSLTAEKGGLPIDELLDKSY